MHHFHHALRLAAGTGSIHRRLPRQCTAGGHVAAAAGGSAAKQPWLHHRSCGPARHWGPPCAAVTALTQQPDHPAARLEAA